MTGTRVFEVASRWIEHSVADRDEVCHFRAGDECVKPRQNVAWAITVMCERGKSGSQLTHRSGRSETVSHDVTDSERDGTIRRTRTSYQSPPTSRVAASGLVPGGDRYACRRDELSREERVLKPERDLVFFSLTGP